MEGSNQSKPIKRHPQCWADFLVRKERIEKSIFLIKNFLESFQIFTFLNINQRLKDTDAKAQLNFFIDKKKVNKKNKFEFLWMISFSW